MTELFKIFFWKVMKNDDRNMANRIVSTAWVLPMSAYIYTHDTTAWAQVGDRPKNGQKMKTQSIKNAKRFKNGDPSNPKKKRKE